MELTKKQEAILEYIQEYIKEHGYAPSVREIAANFELASPTGAHRYLKVLEQKGYISSDAQISRSIRVLGQGREPESSVVELPLKGKVAAGHPINYMYENETMAFPEFMVRRAEKSFVLQVQGDSMIEESIMDGDYVIVEERDTCDNGEMVIAMIRNEEATLKRLYRQGREVRLQPSNPTMEPIYVPAEQVSVKGVVIGVFRQYH